MKYVTLIHGDGIGPEITSSLKQVIAALKTPIVFEEFSAGAAHFEKTGTFLPEELFASLEKTKVGIKGPMTTPIGTGYRSLNVKLRKDYDLYANVRPVKNLPGVFCRYEEVDLVIFRENTEDLYAGIEEEISHREARSMKIITWEKSERLLRRAFDYAMAHNKDKVTVVTKANIMKATDGLFLTVAREVAKDYPIALEEVLVDNMCMQLVMNPSQYGIIATENLYGDILSDLCAGLVGGLGVVGGANFGENMALFESVHGTAPDIAGKNLANPTAMLLTGAMMLEYLEFFEDANHLRSALYKVLENPRMRTKDLGGELTCSGFTDAVVSAIERSLP